MKKLRVLDLFSGIGGFSLGLERTGGFETVAFCEYAEFPRKVLAKHWPDVPIYPDVRELTAERLNADGLGSIDLICGGYPCQPFSHAGKRLGAEDDRHLWPEMRSLVETLRPAWVIGENVAGHVSMGLDDVLSDLGALGYACQAFVIPACAVNAPHRRDRVWLVAYARCELRPRPVTESGSEGQSIWNETAVHAEQCGASLAYASFINGEGQFPAFHDAQGWQGQNFRQAGPYSDGDGWGSLEPAVGGVADGLSAELDGHWSVEPDVLRVAKGVKNRGARLSALGNAVVPAIPQMIGAAILQSMKEAA